MAARTEELQAGREANGPGSTTGARDAAVGLALAALAVAAYSIGLNRDFAGDDDYLGANAYVNFAKLLALPHSLAANGVTHYLQDLFWQVFYVRHGPVPSLYYGVFLALANLARAPWSRDLIHLPVACMAGLSAGLFFIVLRNQGLGWGMSGLGTALLMASPLYCAISRGISSSYAVGVVFGQVLLMLGLQRFQANSAKWGVAALGILNLGLSDNLFFLSFLAGLSALALAAVRKHPWKTAVSDPVDVLREALTPLREPAILGAVMIAIGVALAAVGIALASRMVKGIPVPCLANEFLAHGEGTTGFSPSWGRFVGYTQVLGGYFFPFAFAIALAGWLIFSRRAPNTFAWNFSALAALGFGALFYAIYQDDFWVANLYQAYVLAPVLLLLVVTLSRLAARAFAKRGAAVASAGLLAVLAAAALGTTGYVFRAGGGWIPPLTASDTAANPRLSGVAFPNSGSEATGYLVRRALEGGPKTAGEAVAITGSPRPSSILVYAGLAGQQPSGGPTVSMPAEQPLACSSPTCVTVTLSPADTQQRYQIMDGAKALALVTVQGESALLPPAGTYQRADLEAQFERTYHSLSDFFPGPFWRVWC